MSNDKTTNVCLFFQAHQPFRIRSYDFFQIGNDPNYFDDALNRDILHRVADRCYLPALQLFEELHHQTEGNFKAGLGISGTLITQLEKWRPDVLQRFQSLVAQGILFVTGGTYSNSLATFFSAQEAGRQIRNHRQIIKKYFQVKPTCFANTELIYRDDMVQMIKSFGYHTILAEGVQRYLGHRAPNFMYHANGDDSVKLLLRNAPLSDDIGFRFSDTSWDQWPLCANTYTDWILDSDHQVHNIFLDLETMGEHHDASSGIFDFWRSFILNGQSRGLRYLSPNDVAEELSPVDSYSSPKHSSWADYEKDKSAWQSNVMQQEASQKVFRLQQIVESSNCPHLFEDWSRLQSADHFLHMSTKGGSTGEAHRKFRVHADPYDSYSYFMNILADLQIRAKVKMARHLLEQIGELAPLSE